MPHRELVPLFFPGLRPTPSGGIAPKSKKRVGRWGTERGAHAGSPRGVLVHHLTSGGTADRLGPDCGLTRAAKSADYFLRSNLKNYWHDHRARAGQLLDEPLQLHSHVLF
jgi:hypothetical protein